MARSSSLSDDLFNVVRHDSTPRRASPPRTTSGSGFSGSGSSVVINIYVGNLSFKTTEDEVRDLFAQHGDVDRVSLVTDRETGRPRGFGFVEMRDAGQGRAAIEALNGIELGGRTLTINEAKPRAERPAGGGGRGGYGGGGGGGRGGDRGERRPRW
ncbi:MAG: RNA-binding protein [Phycisphaeraceae bacterium]|nr:RNA-binding protein [Phycisphaerales bacterium]QOJ18646.1 MAG: RNA-binding protein [Phycisphaeraceae bacterium]